MDLSMLEASSKGHLAASLVEWSSACAPTSDAFYPLTLRLAWHNECSQCRGWARTALPEACAVLTRLNDSAAQPWVVKESMGNGGSGNKFVTFGRLRHIVTQACGANCARCDLGSLVRLLVRYGLFPPEALSLSLEPGSVAQRHP